MIVSMVVYCTEENKKDQCLLETLKSLWLQLRPHDKLVLSVNGFTNNTKEIIDSFGSFIDEVIYNEFNLGTSEALNIIWKKYREPGSHVIKLDDDVLIHSPGWVEEMEQAISRDPRIGIIGLKRKDLIQCPSHPDPHFRSELILLPHKPGERWITVERTGDIIGTCTMFNGALLDKVGYSRQPGKYGFEDSLFCHRSHMAGFYNCFLNHIEIDHIDNTPTPYIDWKKRHSEEHFKQYHSLVHAMIAGTEPIYYNPFNHD